MVGNITFLMIRDNDAALALGARPIQEHESAASHIIKQETRHMVTAAITGCTAHAWRAHGSF